MKLDQIDALYSTGSRYPLTEDVYNAVRAGNVPEGYETRLTLKEIQAGVVWSLELGRKKAGAEVKAAPVADEPPACVVDPTVALDEQIAGIGHNGPPDTISADKAILAEVSALSGQVKTWLGEIDGKPRNKAEADTLADYATRFKALATKSEEARTAEKKPHLEACREIDAKWKRSKDNADGARKRCLEIGQEWMDAENARLKAEADAVNAQAKAAAEKNAQQFDAPVTAPPPVEAEKVSSIGMAEIPADLLEAMNKIAQRQGAAGVDMPGVTKDVKRTAA